MDVVSPSVTVVCGRSGKWETSIDNSIDHGTESLLTCLMMEDVKQHYVPNGASVIQIEAEEAKAGNPASLVVGSRLGINWPWDIIGFGFSSQPSSFSIPNRHRHDVTQTRTAYPTRFMQVVSALRVCQLHGMALIMTAHYIQSSGRDISHSEKTTDEVRKLDREAHD